MALGSGAVLATGRVVIRADTNDLKRGLTGARSDFRGAVNDMEGHTHRFAGALGTLGKSALLVGGAAGVGGLVLALKGGFEEMKKSEQVTAQTNQALKTTGGVANVTAKHIDELANALLRKTGVDDEAIRTSENLLLAFTNVRNEAGKGNDVFDRTTKVIQDYAARTGKDAVTATVIFGKAMQDPTKYLGALARAGVVFDEGTKKQIKTLQASGDQLGAQKLLLQELEKRYKGAAEAAGDTLAGKLSILHETTKNLEASLVQGLAPALTAVVTKLAEWVNWLQTSQGFHDAVRSGIDGIRLVFEKTVSIVKALIPAFSGVWAVISEVGKAVGVIAKTIFDGFKQIFSVFQSDGGDPGHSKSTMKQMHDVAKTIGDVLHDYVVPAIRIWAKVMATEVKIITTVIRVFVKAFKLEFEAIVAVISTVVSAVRGIVTAFTNAFRDVRKAIGSFLSYLGGLPGEARDKGSAIGLGVVTGVLRGLRALVSSVKRGFGALWDAVEGIANTATGYFFKIGAAIIEGIINGLGSLAGAVKDKLLGIVQGAFAHTAGWLKRGSPSRRAYDEIGVPLGQGIILGVEDALTPLGRVIVDKLTKAHSEARVFNDKAKAGGGGLRLPSSFATTHQTSGLAGYPALDVFAEPGTLVLPPEPGKITRLSGHNPSEGSFGAAGVHGWSIYLLGDSGTSYFMTHFGAVYVSVGQPVGWDTVLGTVAAGTQGGGHIHIGRHGSGSTIRPPAGGTSPSAGGSVPSSSRTVSSSGGGGGTTTFADPQVKEDKVIAGTIDRFLRAQGSPMAGEGVSFVAAGRKYGIDPRYLVALAGAESSFGLHCFLPFNPFGWGSVTFGSWREAIFTVAAGLKKGYTSQGRTSVASIASKYAPVGASNDPHGTNAQEPVNVSTYLRRLGGDPGNVGFATSTAPRTTPTTPRTLPSRSPLPRSGQVSYGGTGPKAGKGPGNKRVSAKMQRTRHEALAFMQRIWADVAPYFDLPADSRMPRTIFTDDSFPLVGADPKSHEVFWPDWCSYGILHGYPNQSRNQFLQVLIHEWAHLFQTDEVSKNEAAAEGGATAFARAVAAAVYAKEGIPYQNPSLKGDPYAGFTRKAEAKGKNYVLSGQFGPAYAPIFGGEKVASAPTNRAAAKARARVTGLGAVTGLVGVLRRTTELEEGEAVVSTSIGPGLGRAPRHVKFTATIAMWRKQLVALKKELRKAVKQRAALLTSRARALRTPKRLRDPGLIPLINQQLAKLGKVIAELRSEIGRALDAIVELKQQAKENGEEIGAGEETAPTEGETPGLIPGAEAAPADAAPASDSGGGTGGGGDTGGVDSEPATQGYSQEDVTRIVNEALVRNREATLGYRQKFLQQFAPNIFHREGSGLAWGSQPWNATPTPAPVVINNHFEYPPDDHNAWMARNAFQARSGAMG